MSELTKFDHYLADDGPAALVVREHLMPVEGADGVLFPATFAAGDNFPGGYNIDGDPTGANVCLIDTVGSQANRIEPLFAGDKYRHLIPQIVVKAGDKEVNLIDAGHRAGDAILRCSVLKETVDKAFLASIRGDAGPLAKFAPTSLVFGVWNSRGVKGTQDRRPRIVASTIRAFNVRELRRFAQFVPATEYVNEGLLDEATDKDTKDSYAERGYIHIPVTKKESTHGGVIATGGVRRDATLSIAALRLLHAGKDAEQTTALRRYVLGLSLVAFTHNPSGQLRQGCLLVKNRDKAGENEFVEVHPSGERKPANISHEDALTYATEAAKAFGVGESKTVEFDRERARRDAAGETAAGGAVAGQISSVAANKKKFVIGKGANKVNVSINDGTVYLKDGNESSFAVVVMKDAVVEAELDNGVAVKVTAK